MATCVCTKPTRFITVFLVSTVSRVLFHSFALNFLLTARSQKIINRHELIHPSAWASCLSAQLAPILEESFSRYRTKGVRKYDICDSSTGGCRFASTSAPKRRRFRGSNMSGHLIRLPAFGDGGFPITEISLAYSLQRCRLYVMCSLSVEFKAPSLEQHLPIRMQEHSEGLRCIKQVPETRVAFFLATNQAGNGFFQF